MEPALSAEEEQWMIYNQKQIIQVLNELAKGHDKLKVSFGDDVYVTTIVFVDAAHQAVYFDVGLDDDFNRRLISSKRVLFSKEEGVKIKWTSLELSLAQLKDGKAIKISLPKSLMRMQRREFFRLATPLATTVDCVMPVNNLNEVKSSAAKKVIHLTLLDVSLGGVGAWAADPLDEALVIGARFNECKINFPQVGEASLTLQIKNITQVTLKDGSIKHRIGMQFISPSRSNEGLINRYAYNLECQIIAAAHKF